MNTLEYIEQHKERFLKELFELLKQPSISADPKFTKDVRKTAEMVKDNLINIGIEKSQLYETDGHPIVYGEKIIDEKLPTILIYGHYDVQPPDPLDLWESEPFNPVVRDGKIYARGACDDKGQFFMHVKAAEIMIKTNTLPCNIKFMIEGEEEVGSENLESFVKNNKNLLTADIILISDTGIIANDTPSITTGLRGLSYVEVEVTGPNRDLHSGLYGGAVANPINILCKMISSLHDENNHITIPGFYENVEIISRQERDLMAQAPFNLDKYKEELNISDVYGEDSYTTMERNSIRPTLDVNGIWGGYTGEGAKTVIASKAFAKISMRLVPNQKSDEITRLFQSHFESIAPSGVTVKVTPHHGGEAYVSPTNEKGYLAASKAMQDSFGKEPIPVRSGGSIPIVALFEKELGLKSILMGFGLDSDAIHSPNEHYGLFNFFKGIETIPLFFKYFSK
ncbi:MAG: peptidase dimerization domain protein [Flavobacteriales bacterium]|jgi:acetylornithine deacetylase/succinyl-diaminopimelate desuccinylase-like protein|nr:peptidase dimerization domain protein [Flavobacteriales bacterium]|tara:strand:+ start:9733 stop:11091 length:1359 start_codon:yes stop_codon:yes gene_type:complete